MLSNIVEITKNAFAVRHPIYLTNSYIVKTSNGIYLIDSGVYADGSDMLSALRKLGISPKEIKGFLLTHWHNDHTGGASVLRSQRDGLVYYHKDASDHFNGKITSGILKKIFDFIPDFGPFSLNKGIVGQCPPRPLMADKFVSDGDNIDGLFTVWETPGHEIGHLSYWFPEVKMLFTGDAIAVCGNRIWYMSSLLTKDQSTGRQSMHRCLNYDAEYICPGHQRPLKITKNNTKDVITHLDAMKKMACNLIAA